MDSKLLLVKSVTLLYRESQLKNKSENSSDLVKSVLSTVKNPEFVVDTEFGREIITSLKKTVIWMADSPLDTTFDKTELLQRIRVNVKDDESLYEAIKDGIEPDLEEKTIKRVCNNYRKELNTYMTRLQVKDILREYSNKANFHEDSIDWRHFVPELRGKLEPFETIGDTSSNPAVVDRISLDKIEQVSGLLQRGKAELSSEGVMRFGIQALNRMFGRAGGIRRGEFCVVGALQYNFKSGMSLTMMKGMALYNKPHMRDAGKTPLIYRYSFENSAADDILWLYKSLVEGDTGKMVDITTVDSMMAAGYVKERLQDTGYKIMVDRIDPTSYTFYDVFDDINRLEAEGYEIHGVIFDYLNMMSKLGCNQGPAGTEVRDLFRRMRNFFNKRGTAVITPHQLSTEAKMLLRLGSENFVQEIANKGYWDSCKTIDQEVDIEIYQHIVKTAGEKHLTIQRGKHRGTPELTPEKDLYSVLKFQEVGGIIDDINGRDLSRRHIGGSAVADGGDPAWY